MTNTMDANGSDLSRRRFVGRLGLAGLGATLATGLAELVGGTSAQAKQAHHRWPKAPNVIAAPDASAACASPNFPWTCFKATGQCGGPCHPNGHCCYNCHNGGCSQHFCINSCASQVEICIPQVCV